MRRESGAQGIEPLRRRQLAEDDALRVAGAQDRGGHGLAGGGDLNLLNVGGLAHGCAKVVAPAVLRQEVERLHPRIAVDTDGRTRLQTLRAGNQRRQAA